MDDQDIAELLLAEITDGQAFLSDEGGDSDAEDDLPIQLLSTPVSSTRSDHSYYSNISPVTSKDDDNQIKCRPSTNAVEQTDISPFGTENKSPITFDFSGDSLNISDLSLISTSSKDSTKLISGQDPILTMPSTSKACFSVTSLRPPKKKNIVLDLHEDEPQNLYSDDTDEDPSYSPTSNKYSNKASNLVFGTKQSCVGLPLTALQNVHIRSSNNNINVAPTPTSKKVSVDNLAPNKNKRKAKSQLVYKCPKIKKTKPVKVNKYYWSKYSHNPRKFEHSSYDQTFGVILDIDYNDPTLIFKNIIDADICKVIVMESNEYAIQNGTQLNLTIEELYAFFGILIFTGFHHLPSLRLYWSQDENFHVDRISRVMPLKRFLKILRFLHLNNNTKMPKAKTPEFDMLFKIRPLLDHFSKKYSELFAPSRFLSIDESMAAFKGRSTLKQYMPKKPIKRGFKIWAIACAVTGFLLQFEVYTGKKEGNPELGLGGNVVNFLSESYIEQNRCLFFDNFFSCVNIFESLLAKNTFACGTIRWDRAEYPLTYMKHNNELQKHEHDFAQCQNPMDISVVKWKDRGTKPVSVISNMHNPCKTEIVLRTNNIGVRENATCPTAIADYNRYMGRVDLFDQHMSPYSISRKSRKWWVKLFYYFIDSAIVNSFILHEQYSKKNKGKGMSHLQFRSSLVNGLIDSYTSRKRRGPPPAAGFHRKRNDPNRKGTVQNTIRLSNVGDHLPTIIEKYRRCAFCSTKAKEKRSNMLCETCGVALCKLCFAPFHQR